MECNGKTDIHKGMEWNGKADIINYFSWNRSNGTERPKVVFGNNIHYCFSILSFISLIIFYGMEPNGKEWKN